MRSTFMNDQIASAFEDLEGDKLEPSNLALGTVAISIIDLARVLAESVELHGQVKVLTSTNAQLVEEIQEALALNDLLIATLNVSSRQAPPYISQGPFAPSRK